MPPLPPLVEPGPDLTRDQTERYARHLLLPHIGPIGQRRLLAARVCVIGAGGLGSPVLLYLAAAGVGTLGIVDDDVVDISNLQRQVIHEAASVGEPKVISAARALARLNPDVQIVTHQERLAPGNVERVLADYDLVVDGTDNFPTRYLVNDACDRLGLPFVWASLQRTLAQVATFWRAPSDKRPGVDLRDLFPVPPDPGSVPSCGAAGVLGALCGTVGGLMAGEVIKLVTGTGDPLLGRVLLLDSLATRMTELPLRPRDRSADGSAPQPASCDVDAAPPAARIAPRDLAVQLAGDAPPLVLDVREPGEVAIAAIDGSTRMPLDTLPDRLGELPHDRDIVVHCKSGPRAQRAAHLLQHNGFTHITVLEGGMLAWIDQINPTLPRY